MKLAAIDIGSNAVRLLIQDIYIEDNDLPIYTKVNLIRFPIRLGEDVFTSGKISKSKALALSEAMKVYKLAMKIHQVDDYRAFATSAMRDAKNGAKIAQKIFEETELFINIISGEEEAKIIFDNHLHTYTNPNSHYLYIDVGGGSTEITLMHNQQISSKASFNIGTIRLLNKLDCKDEWSKLKSYLINIKNSNYTLQAIGTGGNINKAHSLALLNANQPLSSAYLHTLQNTLEKMSIAERKQHFKLKEDRSDVIVPALQRLQLYIIYL